MKYRSDIDGLRAVAIVPVLLFHLGLSFIPGGFVGVDIFFVISGFLIGKIIIDEMDRGAFSYVRFYERRIRRILPALVVVILAVLAAGWFIMLPLEFRDLSLSALAALGSISNLFFWQTTDYFAMESSAKPLLHTWSLGVEEQFYILLPPLLALTMRRLRRYWKAVIAALIVVSFIASVVILQTRPSEAFYAPWTRLWELMVGVALVILPPISLTAVARNLLALLGAALIAASVFLIDENMPFPGALALPSVAGAALIIWSGSLGDTLVSRILSFKPIVFIGLISYSLYLWHWPIMVYLKFTGLPFMPGNMLAVKVVALALSFAAGALSWRFVERPFRARPGGMSAGRIFRLAAISAVVVTAVSLAIFGLQGVPGRYTAEAARVGAYLGYDTTPGFPQGRCFLSDAKAEGTIDWDRCLAADPSKPDYLIIGDSHAHHLWYGINTVHKDAHVMLASASGCRPVAYQPSEAAAYCARLMARIYRDYLPGAKIDRLIIAGRWRPDDVPALERTLVDLKAKGVPVVVFGPIVEYDAALPRLLALGIQSGDPQLPARHVRKQVRATSALVAAAARRTGTPFVSEIDLLCDAAGCETYAAGRTPMQFDYGHLTREGSVYVAERSRALIAPEGP